MPGTGHRCGHAAGAESAGSLTHFASLFRQRLTFALGQYSSQLEPGEHHDGPQKGSDQGPQEASAQGDAPFGRLDLMRALAEEVLIGKSG